MDYIRGTPRHYCLSDKPLFWPSLVWRDLWLYVRRVHLGWCTGSSVVAFGFDHSGSYRAPLLLFLMATLLVTRLGPYVYRAT